MTHGACSRLETSLTSKGLRRTSFVDVLNTLRLETSLTSKGLRRDGTLFTIVVFCLETSLTSKGLRQTGFWHTVKVYSLETSLTPKGLRHLFFAELHAPKFRNCPDLKGIHIKKRPVIAYRPLFAFKVMLIGYGISPKFNASNGNTLPTVQQTPKPS